MSQTTRRLKNYFHLLLVIVANIYYGFPSRKIKVIGVTGTDGKTTTTHLIYHILKTAGKQASFISSVRAHVGGKTNDTGFHVTTPSPFAIQKYLRQAVDHTDAFFVLETTSHALDQYRVWGIRYEVSVITNITHEHLDYHGTYDEYIKTKLKLFSYSKILVVNKDDISYKRITSLLDGKQYITYGLRDKADVGWNDKIRHNLAGEYNRYNILAAYAVAKTLHINEMSILSACETFELHHGRQDVVYKKDFTVIIDFAHTPYALQQFLRTIRKEFMRNDTGRLIHIFGSAGLRDATKRPKMGEVSGEYADGVILTEEDYRTEDVKKICQAISMGLLQKGFQKVTPDEFAQNARKKIFTEVYDRQEAINMSVGSAQKGDFIVMTGKGHEKSLCRGKTEYPWDEHGAVEKALQSY